jgi:hypothetical protein
VSVPNLKEIYERQYRIALDPSATSWHDPWMHVIPLRVGEVYVHATTHAGIEVDSRRRAALAFLRQAGYHQHLGGDDVTTFLVPWPDLPAVLRHLRPYRRRQVSESERQRLAEMTRPYRFRAGHGRGERISGAESTLAPSAGGGAVC